MFNSPWAIDLATSGEFYVTDYISQSVRIVNPEGSFRDD
jgi:hypothetical protein